MNGRHAGKLVLNFGLYLLIYNEGLIFIYLLSYFFFFLFGAAN